MLCFVEAVPLLVHAALARKEIVGVSRTQVMMNTKDYCWLRDVPWSMMDDWHNSYSHDKCSCSSEVEIDGGESAFDHSRIVHVSRVLCPWEAIVN